MSESAEELRKRVVSWGTDYTAPNQVRVRGAKVLLDDMLKYIKEQADLIETLERMNLNQFKKIAELQEGKRVDTGLLRFLANRIEQLEQALTDLLPYTDAIICYASTISEHDGNRVAKVLADLAGHTPITSPQRAGRKGMSDYKPEEIAKRLDKGIPTGPELVKAAECIRGLDELIQMQEDEIDRLQARLDAIPWEAIDQNVAVLETLMDVHAALHLDGPLACLRSIQALREEDETRLKG